MPPIPCQHCGQNFMRIDLNPDALRLCHNCSNKELSKIQKGKKKVDTIGILIECPKETHAEIEELCISKGLSLSQYFLDLHVNSVDSLHEVENLFLPNSLGEEGVNEEENEKPIKKKGRPKGVQSEF